MSADARLIEDAGGAMSKRAYEINGNTFHDLEGFFDEIQRSLVTAPWGRNLNAFNDVLRGGFGTPEEGFVLRWLNSSRSRAALAFPEAIQSLDANQRCQPANHGLERADLAMAHGGQGETLFESIVRIIRTHGPGGEEANDGVELELL